MLVFRVKSTIGRKEIIALAGEATSWNALERTRAEENSNKREAKKALRAAILGGIASQAMGKDTKATVIGAAAGAAAGTIAATATVKNECYLPAEPRLNRVLSADTQVPCRNCSSSMDRETGDQGSGIGNQRLRLIPDSRSSLSSLHRGVAVTANGRPGSLSVDPAPSPHQ